jgi:hypothetical protein
MPTTRMRVSVANVISSGASSRQGTHHEAQTLSTATSPVNVAPSRPGTGLLSRSSPASGGRLVCGATCPIKADGMREGSPEPSRNMNSAASARKATSGMSTISRRRNALASCSMFPAAFSSSVLMASPRWWRLLLRAPSGA